MDAIPVPATDPRLKRNTRMYVARDLLRALDKVRESYALRPDWTPPKAIYYVQRSGYVEVHAPVEVEA